MKRLWQPALVLVLLLNYGTFANFFLGQIAAQESDAISLEPDIQAIIDAGRNGNQVQQHLDYLTNRIGPRLTGSEGLQAAGEWARTKFEEMGLESRLEKWGEFPVGFERGPSFGRMIEPKQRNLSFGTNAWTAGTKGKVVARVLIAPKTMDELDSMREELDGAFVLAQRVPRMRRGFRGRGRGAPSAQRQQRSNQQQGEGEKAAEKKDDEESDEAAKKAAEEREKQRLEREAQAKRFEEMRKVREELVKCNPAGIIQSTSDERILTGGNYRVDMDDLPKIPVISLLKENWDEIHELAQDGQEVKLAFDIRNHFRAGPISLYNVIADIPGTEWPDQYVIVGGHLDSWDGATGATDNAAGCATTIEAARILMAAGVKPKRTIRFMLWSGEEQGLLGSRAYVEKNKESVQENVSAVFVHDGGTNYVAGIRCTEAMKEDFEKVFAAAMKLDERTPFEIATAATMRAGGGSDHVPFIAAGVPGFFWMQRGRAVYRVTHHTQYDTYETVVPEYQQHSSIVIALGAYGTANLDHLLPRDGIQARR